MKIIFTTKQQSKEIQEREFMKLSPSERVARFFELCSKLKKFPVSYSNETVQNFQIVFKNEE